MKIRTILATAAVFTLAGLAHATTTGINTDPAGSSWDRGLAGTAYAQWDIFSGTSFSNDAPGSFFGISDAALSQSSVFTSFGQGAGLYKVATTVPSTALADNDVLFAGGNNLTFSLTGTLDFTARGVTLQIKRPNSTGTLADASGFTPTLTINGFTFGADSTSLASGAGNTSGSAGTYATTTWYWGPSLTGLTDVGSSTFTVSFSKVASQRLIDGVAVDFGPTAPVPEPGTYAVAAALLVLVGFRACKSRRNRAAARA